MPIMEKLNDLVIKKREEEERDPHNRVYRKEKILQNSHKAAQRSDSLPFDSALDVQDTFEESTRRI